MQTELLDLANVTGLIVDRTASPEVVLGQGCLSADLRLVTCASAVFNYVKAPSVLAVKFPHPNLVFGVKRLTLHPAFNATYARMHYLSQTGLPSDPLLVVPNDLGRLVLEPTVREPLAAEVAELETALKPGLEHYGAAQSGAFEGPELASVIQKVRAEGTAGLLTLLNQRNRPIAYLWIGPGPQSFIKAVAFRNLTRNLALFELLHLKPGGTYLFQPSAPFPGPATLEMNTPAEALLEEGLRRAADTPQLMAALGGADARYLHLEGASLNPEAVPVSVRSLVGRLWRAVDGYITLGRLSERTEVDTYLALRCIHEMANNGLIRPDTGSPFNRGGKLGAPLQSVPIDILKDGDPLTAFYLDPITGEPCSAQGDFRGYVESKDANWLLHSVPCPSKVQGAPLLLGNQLVGLNTGPHIAAPGYSGAVKLYEMVCINAQEAIATMTRPTTTAGMKQRFAVLEEQMSQVKAGSSSLVETQKAPAEPESPPPTPHSPFEAEPTTGDHFLVIPQRVNLGRPVLERAMVDVVDSIGLVLDRAVSPEFVLGQGCLTDKNRFSICASAVSHYAKTPWTLAVKFPAANVVYAVRAITLHPDFNSRYARLQSFARTGMPGERPPVVENDLALLVLDSDFAEIEEEVRQEHESELALPLSGEGQHGTVEGSDIRAVIEKILAEGNAGVLSFLDERNRQMAHLLIAKRDECFIQKAHFNGLTQHLALFELLHRRPRGAYHFQSARELDWPAVPDIEASAKELLDQGDRRAAEISELMAKLGGPETRYVQVDIAYDRSRVDPHSRWMARRVWDVLDGFITLDHLWQRTRADTYLSLRGLRELLEIEAVRLEELPPYGRPEHLGPPIFPAHAEGLSLGDPLAGVFLDPVTARPYVLQGDFLGFEDPDSPNCLLHSVRFPPELKGGLVISDKQLLGLNTGLHDLEERETGSGLQYELIAIDALSDLRAKKQRITATREMSLSSVQQRLTGGSVPAPAVPDPLAPEPEGAMPAKKSSMLRIVAPVVGLAFLIGIGSYLFTFKGGVSESVEPVESQPGVESANIQGAAEKTRGAVKLPAAPEKPTLPAAQTAQSSVAAGMYRPVFSGSLADYARVVETSFQSSYRPPDTGKASGKAVVTVNIAPNGKASGFFITHSTGDIPVDRHIIRAIVKAVYPPAPYRPGEDPDLEFTIDGAKVHVAVPSK